MSLSWWAVGSLLAIFVVLLVGPLARANELFVLRWQGRGLDIVRGRLPGRLHDDLEDVVQRSGIRAARIRVISRDRRPVVEATGLPADVLQRVRNVIGPYRVAEIRAGGRRAGRSR